MTRRLRDSMAVPPNQQIRSTALRSGPGSINRRTAGWSRQSGLLATEVGVGASPWLWISGRVPTAPEQHDPGSSFCHLHACADVCRRRSTGNRDSRISGAVVRRRPGDDQAHAGEAGPAGRRRGRARSGVALPGQAGRAGDWRDCGFRQDQRIAGGPDRRPFQAASGPEPRPRHAPGAGRRAWRGGEQSGEPGGHTDQRARQD